MEGSEEAGDTSVCPDDSAPAPRAELHDITNHVTEEQPSTEHEPKQHAPKAESPKDHAPNEESSIDHAPNVKSSTEHAPREESPIEDAPNVEAPKENAPKAESPTQHAPNEDSSLEHAPNVEAPIEHAPRKESPTEHAPNVESSIEHVPNVEALKENTPKAESPTEHVLNVDAPIANGPNKQTPTDDGAPEITVESEVFEDLPVTPQKSNGQIVVQGSNKNSASERLQRVRKWSITTYKCTRQALAERLGRGSRTVDLDLEPRLELLKDDRQRFDHMTKLAQTLANQIAQVSVTQKALGDVFADLSIKTPTLHAQFGLNAEAQRYLSKSGETLSAAVNSFISDMTTLVNTTIEDTMINAKQYEAVRIEYDAYRVDLEELNLGPRDPVTVPKLEQAQRSFQEQRERYQRSRDDLSVKLKLLEENKVKVLHNQLWLLHNAMASHCLNAHRFLQNNMLQAQNMSSPVEDAPSWLEDS